MKYYIINAYDHDRNKVNHKIVHSEFMKEIIVFIWCIKYNWVKVI
jgi:hypothetical protein